MIQLDTVPKQHGPQILFLDASMGLFPGEKIGLVPGFGFFGRNEVRCFDDLCAAFPPD